MGYSGEDSRERWQGRGGRPMGRAVGVGPMSGLHGSHRWRQWLVAGGRRLRGGVNVGRQQRWGMTWLVAGGRRGGDVIVQVRGGTVRELVMGANGFSEFWFFLNKKIFGHVTPSGPSNWSDVSEGGKGTCLSCIKGRESVPGRENAHIMVWEWEAGCRSEFHPFNRIMVGNLTFK